jgi:hypothetical protein
MNKYYKYITQGKEILRIYTIKNLGPGGSKSKVLKIKGYRLSWRDCEDSGRMQTRTTF